MKKSIEEVLNLVESVHDDEDVAGVVSRYQEELVSPDGAHALVARLQERREGLSRWKGIVNLIKRVHMQDAADARHELETVTQSLLRAEDAVAMAQVVKEHPIAFTGTFISSLIDLQKQAMAAGDTHSARLVGNRLRHLQLLQLARIQELEITHDNLKTIVHQVLEARSFADLLDRFKEYPITFSEAFDEILRELTSDVARAEADPKLPKVAELRIDVLRGLRHIVETFVRQRPAKGGPDDATEALIKANRADAFLETVADYPFVLGEDFVVVIERELERARTEADENVVKGLERRMDHLRRIGVIVSQLTGDPDELEQQVKEAREERRKRQETIERAVQGEGDSPSDSADGEESDSDDEPQEAAE